MVKVVSIADANGLWIRVYILPQMRNSNQNPWTDADSKFEDPHVSATELNCEAGERKWTVYVQVFGLKLRRCV